MNLLVQFLLTIILELIVVFLFLRKDYIKTVIYVFLINLFTWPIANLIYGMGLNYYAVEAGIVLVESVLFIVLFKMSSRKALLISLVANFVSAFAGRIIFY